MKKSFFILLVLISNIGFSQTNFSPAMINTAGGSGIVGTDHFDYTIGEPIVTFGGATCDSFFVGFQHLAVDTFTNNISTILENSTLTFCLNDNVILTAVNANSYLWNTNETTQSIAVTQTGVYSVSTFNSCGDSIGSNEVSVTVLMPPSQELCVVTTDSATGNHNVIVWEKPGNLSNIDSFYVYREISASVYTKIHSAHVSDTSVYEDFAANPNQQSWKYKIAVLDSCGNEGNLSLFHETIHLQYGASGNFNWNHYIIEPSTNPVSNYLFYKDDLNDGNWALIGSPVSNSFTDVGYASTPNAVYRVLVNWSISCSPSRTGVNTSRSNIKNAGLTPGSINEEILAGLTIAPNPATEIINIQYGKHQGNIKINILDAIGKSVFSSSHTLNQIDVSGFSDGIYMILFETEYGIKTLKFVKE